MNKFIKIFIIVFITPIILYSQKDSIPTLILQRINENGRPVQKIIKPNKEIKVLTIQNKKYWCSKIILINDSSLLLNTDTILLKNIKNISAYYKGCSPLKLTLIIAGLACLPVAIAALLPRYGGSSDADEWNDYNKGRENYIVLEITGFWLILDGIVMPKYKKFDTENNWIIKVGNYNKK